MRTPPTALRRELLRLSADSDPRAAWADGRAAWLARLPDCPLQLLVLEEDGGVHPLHDHDGLPMATPGAVDSGLDARVLATAPLRLADGSVVLPICAGGELRLFLHAGPLQRRPLRQLSELAKHCFGSLARILRHQHHQPIEDLADVQRALLPEAPEIRGLDYALHYQPAAIAGGDYYDLMPLQSRLPADRQRTDRHAFGCMIADVSGHGAAAAMEVVQFDAILRTWKGGGEPGPAAVLSYANQHFFSRRSRGRYLTVFALFYAPDRRELLYVCAGHPPALLRRGNQVEVLGDGGDIPLGVLREHVYTQHRVQLQAGDRLILYTDGMIEACDSHGRRFGMPHLMALAGSGSAEPTRLRDRLRDAVQAHQGGQIGTDDQTLLVLALS